MKLKVGIIGAGYIGKIHGQILSQDERVLIVGVADTNQQAADYLAETIKTQSFSSLEELIDESDENIDAVFITTPNTTHTHLTCRALENNLHVFCEKPMATNLEDADRILNLVRSKNLIYQVGHNRRFAPSYEFARNLIERKEFIPFSAHVKMNRGELKNPAWVSDVSLTGGFLYESTIHLLDMVRWLLGEVKSVECVAYKNVYEEMDDFAMILTFEQGKISTDVTLSYPMFFKLVAIFVNGITPSPGRRRCSSFNSPLGRSSESLI